MNDRVKVLQQIGMKDLSAKLQKNLNAQDLINKYTAMKFKVTTVERIREQLCGRPYNKKAVDIADQFKRSSVALLWTAFIPGAFIAITGHMWLGHPLNLQLGMPLLILTGIGAAIRGIMISAKYDAGRFEINDRYKFPELRKRPLAKWKDNLPTGAVLALQEAKEKGLSKFEIYYPVKKTRMKADPVIIGYDKKDTDKKVMLEIFAWDDSKTYDPILKKNEIII